MLWLAAAVTLGNAVSAGRTRGGNKENPATIGEPGMGLLFDDNSADKLWPAGTVIDQMTDFGWQVTEENPHVNHL